MGRKLMTPGDYIHDRRREVGITRGEMARLIGAGDDHYRDIERDDRRPTDDQIAAIARLLRIDPAMLLRRYGRPVQRQATNGHAAADAAGPAPAGGGPDVTALQKATGAAESRTEAVIAATEEIRRQTAEAKLAASVDSERVCSAESTRALVARQLAAEQARVTEAITRRAELIRMLTGDGPAWPNRAAPANRAPRSR